MFHLFYTEERKKLEMHIYILFGKGKFRRLIVILKQLWRCKVDTSQVKKLFITTWVSLNIISMSCNKNEIMIEIYAGMRDLNQFAKNTFYFLENVD